MLNFIQNTACLINDIIEFVGLNVGIYVHRSKEILGIISGSTKYSQIQNLAPNH